MAAANAARAASDPGGGVVPCSMPPKPVWMWLSRVTACIASAFDIAGPNSTSSGCGGCYLVHSFGAAPLISACRSFTCCCQWLRSGG